MSDAVVLNAFHRSFLGLDDFLGHVSVPLSQFQIYERPRSRCVHRRRCAVWALRSSQLAQRPVVEHSVMAGAVGAAWTSRQEQRTTRFVVEKSPNVLSSQRFAHVRPRVLVCVRSR